MVNYDNCQNSHHNEPLSCMGAKASQPTNFLKFRLIRFQLSEIDCNSKCLTKLCLTSVPLVLADKCVVSIGVSSDGCEIEVASGSQSVLNSP